MLRSIVFFNKCPSFFPFKKRSHSCFVLSVPARNLEVSEALTLRALAAYSGALTSIFFFLTVGSCDLVLIVHASKIDGFGPTAYTLPPIY